MNNPYKHLDWYTRNKFRSEWLKQAADCREKHADSTQRWDRICMANALLFFGCALSVLLFSFVIPWGSLMLTGFSIRLYLDLKESQKEKAFWSRIWLEKMEGCQTEADLLR